MPTASEALVFKLCRSSFMSLWSYASPQREDLKELCDVLVVCDPHVLIFSVKEVRAKDTGRPDIDWERWTREAIEKSAKQAFGAERYLKTQSHVLRRDGARGLPLPNLARRRVHRILVALGSEGKVPIAVPQFDEGHVHILDERSLDVVMNELDTITDFTNYLDAKASLLANTGVMAHGEEDLLAIYLKHGRVFPSGHDFMMLDAGLWDALSALDAVKARRAADAESSAFDEILHRLMEEAENGTLEPGSDLTMTEELLRVMALEHRFSRRVLGEAFMGLMRKAAMLPGGLSRKTLSTSGVVYVFLAMPRIVPRAHRQEELGLRTFVARGVHSESTTAIGIATEQLDGQSGLSIDGCLVRIEVWQPHHQKHLADLQRDLGIFVSPEVTTRHADEYPEPPQDGTVV